MLKDDNQTWQSFLIEMLILLSVVLFIRFYIFQFFRVSGASMCPTLNQFQSECRTGKGEFIFVNEFLYNFVRDPERGEIVVIKAPYESKHYIKRVIGVPGDTVEIKQGKVFLNNDEMEKPLELEEPYLSSRNRGRTRSQKSRMVVPDDHYVLFGDNRNNSRDSRQCFKSCDGKHTPFLEKSNIQGKASFVVFPFGAARGLE